MSAADEDRLDRMLADIRAFVAEREWEPYHDPKNLAMALASEAGELLSELRWIPGDEADAHCKDDEHGARVRDELADVMICALMFADRVGIDVSAAVHDKLVRIREKYPIETSRG